MVERARDIYAVRKKPIAPVKIDAWPHESCRVCMFCHSADKDSGLCSAFPPQFVDSEEGVFSFRHPSVELSEAACWFFRPKHHA